MEIYLQCQRVQYEVLFKVNFFRFLSISTKTIQFFFAKSPSFNSLCDKPRNLINFHFIEHVLEPRYRLEIIPLAAICVIPPPGQYLQIQNNESDALRENFPSE